MKRLYAVCLILILCLSLTGCASSNQAYEKYTKTFFGTFDTVITIQGFSQSKEAFDKAADQAESLFQTYHRLYDNFHPYEGLNNVYTLNQEASKAPVVVDKALFELIKFCKDHYEQTLGKNNIALGSVLSLWHDARSDSISEPEKAYLPDPERLKRAAIHTDINDIVLNEADMSVFFADPELSIDLGAVAKGYATELVAQEMLKSEVTSFYINAGGNVRLGSGPMDGRDNWGVAIQDPDKSVFGDVNSDLMDVLFLHNASVVTSGDYQRYFVYEGKRYHHLISPDTLMPTDYMRSVTIITEDSGWADLLSTVVFLLPYEEGRALVESMDGVEAVWILNDRSVQMTEGIKEKARSLGATNPVK